MSDDLSTELDALIEEVRQEYKQPKFIFITAPTERCGITLLQRMLNAGGDCLIYGENNWLLYKLPYWVDNFAERFPQKNRVANHFAEQFFRGHRGADATLLFPNFTDYTKEVFRSFYRMLDLYQKDSERGGCKRWGIKCPLPKQSVPLPLFRLVPSIEVIAIDRNLEDVAKSLCARWPAEYRTEQDFSRLGYRWMTNRLFLKRLAIEKIIHVDYDAFQTDFDAVADRLERALHVRLGRQEGARKINMNAADGSVIDSYRRPVELPKGAVAWLHQGVKRASDIRRARDL